MVRVVVSIIFLSLAVTGYADETELRLYRPFTEGVEQAGFKIASQMAGHCDRQSQLMPREDAWQCQSGTDTFDPCFHKPGKSQTLYCPQSPWNGDSTVIQADIIADSGNFSDINMAENLPWVLLLSSGTKCQRVLENKSFDQQPIEYKCQDNTFLFGRLQRCRSLWSMLRYDNGKTDYVKIRQAWF